MADWHSVSNKPKRNEIRSSIFESRSSTSTSTQNPLPFHSRRSPFLCRNGCVSSSQPLASSIGLQILREKNGNATDAAIATAAALAVLEPCSTGLGGDMFALRYDSSSKKVEAVNGSGRSPSNLTIDALSEEEVNGGGFTFSPHAVTVPGAALGWEDMFRKYGSGNVSFEEVLEPAAKLAEEGFPVTQITSHNWNNGMRLIKKWIHPDNGDDSVVPMSIDGEAPKPGQIFKNMEMANVLRSLGKYGAKNGFYEAFVGEEIVKAVRKHGGVMTQEDLSAHTSTFPEAISADYHGVRMWQVPPNGQGIAGLIALKGLAALEEHADHPPTHTLQSPSSPNAESLHSMIEMMRLGFADARNYVADFDYNSTTTASSETQKHDAATTTIGSTDWLLNKERISTRATKLYNPEKAVIQGESFPTSCTVSFQVVDKDGNAVSFVNSNYMGFGTGIVPKKCGFTLQNRGAGFTLDPTLQHPNSLMPNKRPCHTILPGILTHVDNDDLYATFSNMGGHMQPQGHMQLVVNMIRRGLNPQEAVDAPRFCVTDGSSSGRVFLEEGIEEEVVKQLLDMGHDLEHDVSGYGRSIFGRAQVIKRDRESGVFWAGSDGRADGCAMGY